MKIHLRVPKDIRKSLIKSSLHDSYYAIVTKGSGDIGSRTPMLKVMDSSGDLYDMWLDILNTFIKNEPDIYYLINGEFTRAELGTTLNYDLAEDEDASRYDVTWLDSKLRAVDKLENAVILTQLADTHENELVAMVQVRNALNVVGIPTEAHRSESYRVSRNSDLRGFTAVAAEIRGVIYVIHSRLANDELNGFSKFISKLRKHGLSDQSTVASTTPLPLMSSAIRNLEGTRQDLSIQLEELSIQVSEILSKLSVKRGVYADTASELDRIDKRLRETAEETVESLVYDDKFLNFNVLQNTTEIRIKANELKVGDTVIAYDSHLITLPTGFEGFTATTYNDGREYNPPITISLDAPINHYGLNPKIRSNGITVVTLPRLLEPNYSKLDRPAAAFKIASNNLSDDIVPSYTVRVDIALPYLKEEVYLLNELSPPATLFAMHDAILKGDLKKVAKLLFKEWIELRGMSEDLLKEWDNSELTIEKHDLLPAVDTVFEEEVTHES